MNSLNARVLAAFLSLVLTAVSIPAAAYSSMEDDETTDAPSTFAMIGDIIVARPILLAMTVIGTAGFVLSLPFSALGGNVKESAQMLVVGPAKSTFARCLGCTETQDRWRKERQKHQDQIKDGA